MRELGLLVCLLGVVHGFEVLSQSQQVEVINGQSHPVHYVTVEMDQDDVGANPSFQIVSGDGTISTVVLRPSPPSYVYNNGHMGYIPETQYYDRTKVCLDQVTSAGMAGQTDVNLTVPGAGLGVEDTYFNHIQSHEHLKRRLEVMRDQLQDNLDVGMAFMAGMEKPASRRLLATAQADNTGTVTCSSTLHCSLPPTYANTQKAEIDAQKADVNDADQDDESHKEQVAQDAFTHLDRDFALVGTLGVFTSSAKGGALAVAVGVGLGELCQSLNCFGSSGGGSLQQALRAIEVQIGDITNQLDAISKWSGTQVAWDRTVEQRFGDIEDAESEMSSRITTNTNNIAALQDEVSVLNATQYRMITTFGKEINELKGVIDVEDNNIDVIWNVTRRVADTMQTHYNSLLGSVINLNRQIRRIDKEMLRNNRNQLTRRALTSLYWRVRAQTTPKPATPFLSYEGVPPLTLAQRAAKSTLAQSIKVVTVEFQRSYKQLGVMYAEQRKLSYQCDPNFMLGNIVNVLTFQAMFDFVGPANCNPLDKNDPWTCRCVVVEEVDTCQIPDNGVSLFPWNWGTPFELEDTTVNAASKCTTLLDTKSLDNSGHVVHTDAGAIEALLLQLCSDTNTQNSPNPGDGNPRRMRIFADMWKQYADLGLDPAISDICSVSWSDQMVGTDIHERLAYNVYLLWSMAYDSATQLILPEVEREFFGVMASGMDFHEQPFNPQQKSKDTYACTTMSFVSIGDEKLPMYYASLAQVRQTYEVEIDGQVVHSESTGTSSQATTTKLNSRMSPDANVTVSSDLIVSSPLSIILPGEFYRFGKWDPSSNKIYDVPFNQVSNSGHPNGRIGAVNYIFQSSAWPTVEEDTPFNRSQWEAFFGSEFNSDFVGANPAAFARSVLSVSPSRHFCDGLYAEDGVTLGRAVVNNEFCSILRYFDLVETNSTDPKQSQLSFQPQTFKYVARIQVPGGTLVQNIVTLCPQSADIIRTPGDVTIRLNTSAPEPANILVQIHDSTGGANTACVVYSQQSTYYQNNPALVGPITYSSACGALYVNVRLVGSSSEDGWCYTQPGLKLDVSHSVGSSSTGVAGAIQSAVTQVKDDFVLDLVDQMIANSDYMLKLNDIALDYGASTASVSTRLDAAQEEREKAFDRMNSQTAGVQEQYAKAKQKLSDNAESVQKGIASNRARAKITDALIAELDAENTAGERLLGKLMREELNITADNNVTQAFFAFMKAKIEAAIQSLDDSGGTTGSCGILSFACDAFGGVFGGLGSIFGGLFGGIVHFVFIILIIVAVFYVLKMLLGGCAHGLGNRAAQTGEGPHHSFFGSPPVYKAAAAVAGYAHPSKLVYAEEADAEYSSSGLF